MTPSNTVTARFWVTESMYREDMHDFWIVADFYTPRLPKLPFIVKARFVSVKAE